MSSLIGQEIAADAPAMVGPKQAVKEATVADLIEDLGQVGDGKCKLDDKDETLSATQTPCSTLENEVGTTFEYGGQKILAETMQSWVTEWEAEADAHRQQELADLMEKSRTEAHGASCLSGGPANRFGTNAHFPLFDRSRHVPILALINPGSGALAGKDILAIAHQMPYYRDRFFNIVNVVTDRRRGGHMDVFRCELNAAKEEAKALGVRPRVISGGGDGTASFALFVIFSALCADDSRADEGLQDMGNGFIWSDEELAECFPAIAQMPLGTANDFANTLGWGRKYPGARCMQRSAAERALQEWIAAVISPASRVVNFDLWGFMPPRGEEACDFKLCELGGERGWNPKAKIDGNEHLVMKTASLPVPLFSCLYFSVGAGAYMIARFQNNRRRSALSNNIEYARQVAGILVESTPPQLNTGLDSVTVSCGSSAYFPPRSGEGNTGRSYLEVGFMNVNWIAGRAHGADRAPLSARVCSSREPAKFNDAKLDMFRFKATTFVKNLGPPRFQTDKMEGPITLTFAGGKGKGIFFQWDGEARFAFSPSGGPFSIHIRKIMNIPVVLGTEFDSRIVGPPDNGAETNFAFAGETLGERDEARVRVLRYVRQELNSELNASREEVLAAGFYCQEH